MSGRPLSPSLADLLVDVGREDRPHPDRPSIRDVRDLLHDLRSVRESGDPAEREAFLARKRAMLAAIDQDEQVG